MNDIAEYLRTNGTLVSLRLHKIKPMNLHFLAGLVSPTSSLKKLTLEIFKINNPAFY
jgi:hypothetical protein